MAPATLAGCGESQGFTEPAILASCSVLRVGGAGPTMASAALPNRATEAPSANWGMLRSIPGLAPGASEEIPRADRRDPQPPFRTALPSMASAALPNCATKAPSASWGIASCSVSIVKQPSPVFAK